MSDQQTTVATLRALVQQFVDERDWQKFHAPKNLSMSLAIEAAELMEHFQWISAEASREIGSDATKLAAVAEEVSDVLCYILALANELNIDLSSSLRAKIKKNAGKYPVEEYRGTLWSRRSGLALIPILIV